MYANRMQYVVFYQGKQVLEKLKTLPVDVTYISEKQGYAICYGDKDIEAQLKKQLKDVKGFKHVGTSQTFDPNLNF
ncbi:MAG: hypothetical protein A2Y45_07365 [Tenericutes bacterium GWC2_34_14]|jgi:uncharacterized protein YlbG (UPF0298 family)|nr:MAG: hypothetical protein A2Z84_06795 [Tenericutes bacterium GWA2_35_7]OHE29726.1 MAG: hypothetical protein A2Y45_07365 [Tenericutes bacterium GWC2_34_14]OHE34705.1 MAG: hypothetical protein A2012_00975 [Tenericutes bacterium GWE2_34_108]OHE37434.1 MAG: hypothetical protein A2Y46_02035 [Tenericutes bacterium GWF1_35_14]OHE39431.1 MAG: hypothetical protein A2Y44_00825 [Tenericutes bacterium GWF2_35_184]OHE44379.1 MAG: hypothetical protein A2221_04685 [Tenericutes bacterium RIFOXYA2_FULL_36_3